jgi:hypothetical protein
MMLAAKIDFSLIPVIDVAHELLGQESRERSHGVEKHFPDHSGLFVNVEKNRWYSHGNGVGGDVVSLIRFITDCDFAAAISWLRSHRHIPNQQESRPARRVVATYDYCDELGPPLYHVDRWEPKSFSQWREIEGERVNGVTAGTYERSRSGSGAWHKVKNRPPSTLRPASFQISKLCHIACRNCCTMTKRAY